MDSYSDLKKLDIKSLKSKADELRRERFLLKIEKKTSGLQKSHHFKNLKKQIARIETALSSIENAQA